MSSVRALRLSYRVGALVDALAALIMLAPAWALALYGVRDYEPTVAYFYAMRLGAALMIGWTLLLLWADRKPLERRGVLPITVVVIAGLASAGAIAVEGGWIATSRMVPTWVLQAGLAAFFLRTYLKSRPDAEEAALPRGQVPLDDAAGAFLAQSCFAVAGVSRSGDVAANYIFKRMKEIGREVYAINPNADRVEDEPCYPSLDALPARPDAVVIATHPDRAIDIARQCEEARIPHVWFHRSVDSGSYSEEAVARCVAYGATVIPGSCPMMHLQPVDVPHRCMHAVLDGLGKLPKGVTAPVA